jgi:Uma2 family endonuclease
MFDPQRKYTPDEYWRLTEALPERKYEYIDGDIRMMTGGSPAHGQIAANIAIALGIGLRTQKCNVYSSDVALQLSKGQIYYPDLSVSCDPADRTRKKTLEAPSVVVEVMSPLTERIDRTEKLDAYQRYPTIQDILLVDSQRCHVRHCHRAGVYRWEDALYEQRDDVIELRCIGVSLRVEDIYLRVYLELDEIL